MARGATVALAPISEAACSSSGGVPTPAADWPRAGFQRCPRRLVHSAHGRREGKGQPLARTRMKTTDKGSHLPRKEISRGSGTKHRQTHIRRHVRSEDGAAASGSEGRCRRPHCWTEVNPSGPRRPDSWIALACTDDLAFCCTK